MLERPLRRAIAEEAARLLYQGEARDYYTARRRAARNCSRERLDPGELPTAGEIHEAIRAWAGLFNAERQPAALVEIRLAAGDLLSWLEDFSPRVAGVTLTGPILPGARIEIWLEATPSDCSDIIAVLHDAGCRPHLPADSATEILCEHGYECCVHLGTADAAPAESLDLTGLTQLLMGTGVPADERVAETETDDEGYHPDAFPMMRVLLKALERVQVDPFLHPEGDLLYHSLQVFELVAEQRPYDEELQLAALLHDVGMGLDRRKPIPAAWQAIGGLVTPRTWFFIESRPEAVEYLSTGKLRGALRKSPDREDLLVLARADVAGRQRGRQTRSLDEALDAIASLGSEWDDV